MIGDAAKGGPAGYWAGEAGRNWVAQEAVYDGMHAGIAGLITDRLAAQPGERILDVGSGTGTLALAVVEAVRPGGHVTAVDVSPPMIARATERIGEAGVGDTVCALLADAQTHRFEPESFDAAMSRFGVMFFADPVAAFANIGRAIRPGGRLTMAVWQSREHNEFLGLPNSVVARHVDRPLDSAAIGDPFSFGDPDAVHQILGDTGWIDVGLEADRGTLPSGGPATLDEAVDFTLGRGHVAAALAGADDAIRAAVRADLRAEFATRHDGTAVRLGYAIWIVTARRA